MTTQPYDLDDQALNSVTGGGGGVAPNPPSMSKVPKMGVQMPLQGALDSSDIANLTNSLSHIMETAKDTHSNPKLASKAADHFNDALKDVMGHMDKSGASPADKEAALKDIIQQMLQKGADGGIKGQKGSINTDKTAALQAAMQALASGGGGSTSTYNSKSSQSQAKHQEADEKNNEAQAQQAMSKADIDKASAASIDDVMKQVISYMKDLQDAKAEQMKALTKV